MEHHGFFVRLDAREGYEDKINALALNADYPEVLGVAHKGETNENPHYHLIVRTKVLPQAFRVRFKKIFDQGRGNGHMSIKPWDGDIDACAYMFHEPAARVVIRKGIDDARLEQFKERNKHVQQEVMTAKEKASWKLEAEVIKRMKADPDTFSGDQPTDYEVAYQLVRAAFDLKKYVPNRFQARGMIYNVQYALADGDVEIEMQLAQTIAEKLLQ